MKTPSDRLYDLIAAVADGVVHDPRWNDQKDDLGVAVLGMLLYGFALGQGRLIMMMEIEEIDATVVRVMVEPVGAAKEWAKPGWSKMQTFRRSTSLIIRLISNSSVSDTNTWFRAIIWKSSITYS